MKVLKALLSGFAGATALNLLHETVRRYDRDAPRIDLLGEEVLSRSLNSFNIDVPKGNNLYLATLASDMVSNGLYFSAIGYGSQKNYYTKGIIAGLTAGIGALELAEPIGLNGKPVNRCIKTQILTVTWYLFGGLVTAAVLNQLKSKR